MEICAICSSDLVCGARQMRQRNLSTLQQLLPKYKTGTVCPDPEKYPTPVITRRRYMKIFIHHSAILTCGIFLN